MIKYQKDTDNIVTLTLDMGGRTNNVINHEIFEAFVPVINHLQKEKRKGELRGVILTSAKKTFLAGGDLDYLFKASDAKEIFNFSQSIKQFLRDLEHPGVPVVAAINGSALGAGFEMALACHRRIVLDHPKTKLGLPEVNLGIIPGGGGIVRLMWLLGLEKAYPILSDGYQYTPKEALVAGLIDDLAKDHKEMMLKAKEWLMNTKEGRRPWDRPERQIPGGTAKDPQVAKIVRRLAAQLSSRTHNNFPAPQAILDVLTEASKVDFDTACRIESRYYTELLRSKECKNMIKAFWFDTNAIKKGKNRPKGFGKFRPRRIGIIGAGLMGSGIALACLENNMKVVLKDVSKHIAERGRKMVDKQLEEKISKGHLHPVEKEKMLKNITTTEASSDFETCDLVIEAVFENRMVKQKVTKEAEAYLDEYSLFATNTISIPITKLAEASIRPENYVGLHFFHPASDVPLVEIVRGKNTTDETIARAMDFVKAIRKIPIVVKDDWGFYAARVQNTFILEGITLLQEGYPPALIENLGKQAGMPKGPLELADTLGLSLVLKYENQAAEHYGSKYIQHPAVGILTKMIQELGRTGRFKKMGFYDYHEDNTRSLWPELIEHFPVRKGPFDHQEIIDRLLIAQVLESAWCLQEGVIHSIEGANLGSIYGWGFPAFKGGVIQYMQEYASYKNFVKKCQALSKKYGQRFKVPSTVKKLIV